MHKHLIAIVAGGVCLFVGLCCGGLSGFFFGHVSSTNSTVQPKNVQKQMTREEFRTAVVGKNSDDVINAVGRPDTTPEFGRDPTWYYRNRTRDPVSGKLDLQAQIIFSNGVVVWVNCH